jgi:hypothetical protein
MLLGAVGQGLAASAPVLNINPEKRRSTAFNIRDRHESKFIFIVVLTTPHKIIASFSKIKFN